MAGHIEQITTDAVPEPPGGIYSNCLKVGNQVILSGMTAGAAGGDAHAQSLACLERIKALVEAAGGTLDDVVKMTVYLTDIAHRPDFGKAREAFFPGRKPCSTLVAISALAQPGLLVEVDATAILADG